MSAAECASPNLGSPDGWVKPSDVMRNRRSKRAAIHARLNNSKPLQVLVQPRDKKVDSQPTHRNPFRDPVSKRRRISEPENSQNNTVDLFKNSVTYSPSFSISMPEPIKEVPSSPSEGDKECSERLHVGWRLNFKARFYSDKPIPWKHTFKASERASGISGFARCLHPGKETTATLDSSINARFYQNCQVWQFPSIPGATLFPRDKDKGSSKLGIYASPEISADLDMAWGEALWSLFSALRVRQCPYFYIHFSAFTCIFRAAGLGGFPHAHALITPTTTGFREAMTKDGVEFKMPLNIPKESVDLEEDFEADDPEESDKEAIETEAFLADLGIDSSNLPSFNAKSKKTKTTGNVEGCGSSLVCVEDMELPGFVNFLLNCNTCTTTTGPLAGVPPTLLAPVAFSGGALKALKVSTTTVRTPGGATRYSVEIRGPILPTTLLKLCEQLQTTNDSFEVTAAAVESTLPLCLVSSKQPTMPSVFATEALVDCGLCSSICEAMCKEPLKNYSKLLPISRDIQYKNSKYSWTR